LIPEDEAEIGVQGKGVLRVNTTIDDGEIVFVPVTSVLDFECVPKPETRFLQWAGLMALSGIRRPQRVR